MVLLVSANEDSYSDECRLIMSVVNSLRIRIHTLHPLSFSTQIAGLLRENPFHLIIFEDVSVYFSLPTSSKQRLDGYCRNNSVGVIGFLRNPLTLKSVPGSENFAEVG